MMGFFGGMAITFFVLDFVTATYKFTKLDKIGGRADSLEATLWFIAAMVAFK